MKKIITLLSMMLCLFATAQEVSDTMCIYRNDKTVVRIPISEIDSVVFAMFAAPEVPDTPITPPSSSEYEAVDLGLPSGLLWATCNVGASKPEECGGYYAWGETEEKTDYSWDTYKWCNNGRDEDLTKYCAESLSGTFDNKTLLEAEDDVATVKWGGSWRMPTRAEQDELRNECTWEWTELNGVYGCKVTGPNGNSIFLPAAGSRHDTRISYVGRYGYYWSSSLNDSVSYGFSTYYFYFDANYFNWDNCSREQGLSVRAVCD